MKQQKKYSLRPIFKFCASALKTGLKCTKAFTLVELIVVITILAILWTIAFISLQWYAKDARDSTRLADLKSIEKALEFQLLKGSKIPQPDNHVEITASWTTISYQWYAWDWVLWKISVHWKGKDPLDDTYYTYLTDTNFSNYQLMWFLEWWELISYNNSILNQIKAIDYSERHPLVRWKPLWIIVNSTTKEPLQVIWSWVDIVNTTEEYDVYFADNSKLTWTWEILQYLELSLANWWIKKSCKLILDNQESLLWNDWIYIIDAEWNNPFKVYCDMTNDWWGWTLVMKLKSWNNIEFAWNQTIWWNSDNVSESFCLDLLDNNNCRNNAYSSVWFNKIKIWNSIGWKMIIWFSLFSNSVFQRINNKEPFYWDLESWWISDIWNWINSCDDIWLIDQSYDYGFYVADKSHATTGIIINWWTPWYWWLASIIWYWNNITNWPWDYNTVWWIWSFSSVSGDTTSFSRHYHFYWDWCWGGWTSNPEYNTKPIYLLVK